VDAGVVGVDDAAEGLGGEGRGQVGQADEALRVVGREGADGGHHLGAVDEGEAFLRGELYGLEARGPEGLGSRHPDALVVCLAHAAEDEGHVREGREVAGGAE